MSRSAFLQVHEICVQVTKRGRRTREVRRGDDLLLMKNGEREEQIIILQRTRTDVAASGSGKGPGVLRLESGDDAFLLKANEQPSIEVSI